MKYITSELWEDVEKQETKIKKGVYNCLNYDNFSIVLDGDVFWFEKTWSGASIPEYVYRWVIKWGKRKGYTYLYENSKGFVI